MAEKINQRIMLTKRLLKDSLIEMMKAESIYKISIRDLCESAGINRSTFYKYYGSQFDLLKEIENDLIKDLLTFLKEYPQDIQHAFAQICSYLEQNIDLARLLLNESTDSNLPERLFSLTFIQQEMRKVFKEQYTDDQFSYLSCYITYGCFHAIRLWINNDNREAPEEFSKLITEATLPMDKLKKA